MPNTAGAHTGIMPTFDLTDEEQAALLAYVRDHLREEKIPHAPLLRPVRSALTKLDPASAPKPIVRPPLPEAPMRNRGGGRARR